MKKILCTLLTLMLSLLVVFAGAETIGANTQAIIDRGVLRVGVKNAVVNFMALKMIVEFEEGADVAAVMKNVQTACKKVEDDCIIYL